MVAILSGAFGRKALGSGILTIGRNAANQLVVNDEKASAHHAEIRPVAQGYSIIDPKSTNGTFVNEQRIAHNQLHPLKSGDVIRVGDTRFIYEVSAAPDLDQTIYAPPSALDNDETGSRRLPQNPAASYEAPTALVVPTPQPATQVLKMPPPNPPPRPAIPPTQLASNVTQLAPTQSIGPATLLAPRQSPMNKTVSAPASAVTLQFTSFSAELNEIRENLAQLIDKAREGTMEEYFPGDLPDKAKKIEEWKAQIRRAHACAKLLEQPQFQQLHEQQKRDIRDYLAKATFILDFTREYTVKLAGQTGVGKTTLFSALVGHNIFPRGAGAAITRIPTHVRLSDKGDEMSVHYFTRSEFEILVKETEECIAKETDEQKRTKLTQEKSRLQEAEQAFPSCLTDKGYVETFLRPQWDKEILYYLQEPASTTTAVRKTPLAKYVEFTLHPGAKPFLPSKSVLVDLPGGAAGHPRHDAILREELQTIDALILVAEANRGGDTAETQNIFSRLIQDKGHEGASQMIFVVVTRKDALKNDDDRNRLSGSMGQLLKALPNKYKDYHRHGPEKNFYYLLQAEEALAASIALASQTIDEEQRAKYLEKFAESGLGELAKDLQTFLSRERYGVQLQQAGLLLDNILAILKNFCRDALEQALRTQIGDGQQLQAEMEKRKSEREEALHKKLLSRVDKMHKAWEEALLQFEGDVYKQESAFQQALRGIHQQAKADITNRIHHGHFDRFWKERSSKRKRPFGLRAVLLNIPVGPLIEELHISICTVIEGRISKLARPLADAFLKPLELKEAEGMLDISQIAYGIRDPRLRDLRKEYEGLQREIRKRAHDICLYVTTSELLNKARLGLTEETAEVKEIIHFVGKKEEDADVDAIHKKMISILDKMCAELPENTEDRIVSSFYYELEKLGARPTDDSDDLTLKPGLFTKLVTELGQILNKMFYKQDNAGNTLRMHLDKEAVIEDDKINPWVDLFVAIERLEDNLTVSAGEPIAAS